MEAKANDFNLAFARTIITCSIFFINSQDLQQIWQEGKDGVRIFPFKERWISKIHYLMPHEVNRWHLHHCSYNVYGFSK